MNMEKHGLGELASYLTEAKLHENRIIILSEGVNSDVAKRLITSLLAMDAESKKPITMYVNSPGGEVNSGFAIYDVMRFVKSEVRIVNSGLCASIATIINLGAPKERRYSLPNSRFLIHQPLIGGQVQGPASDLEITAREIIKTRKKINELLAKECNQEFAKVEEDTTRDYWMNAKEALDYGLISKIVKNIDEVIAS